MAFETKQTGLSRSTGFSYKGKKIVLAKKQGKVAKAAHHKGSWYPDDKKIEVATLWAVTKSVIQASTLSGVSQGIIRQWKQEPWFLSIVTQVVHEKNELLDSKLTDIIEKCATMIEDRLLNGDVRVNWKTGEEYVIPLDARGLALVMGIIFDKRQLIRGEATSRTETISTDQKLLKLKAEFEKFSNSTTVQGERLDAPKYPVATPDRSHQATTEAPLPEVVYDPADSAGLQSSVGVGEEPESVEFVPETGQEAPSTGGILQTSEKGIS